MSEYQVKGVRRTLRSPLRSQAALIGRSLLAGSLTETIRHTHTHTPCVCGSAYQAAHCSVSGAAPCGGRRSSRTPQRAALLRRSSNQGCKPGGSVLVRWAELTHRHRVRSRFVVLSPPNGGHAQQTLIWNGNDFCHVHGKNLYRLHTFCVGGL